MVVKIHGFSYGNLAYETAELSTCTIKIICGFLKIKRYDQKVKDMESDIDINYIAATYKDHVYSREE